MKRRDGDGDEAETGAKRSRLESELPLGSFRVDPISRFGENASPTYGKPIELGAYSLDWNGAFHDDARCRKVYEPPPTEKPIAFDLSVGYDEFASKNEDEKHYLNPILKWILRRKDSARGRKVPYDVVTWRGQLTRMMCTPYERREPWAMAATLFDGTVYVAEFETEAARKRRREATDRMKLMCYWGRKFEDYVSRMESSGDDSTKPVNEMEAYCSVASTKFGDIRILMSGEVDCYEKENSNQYVELKTSRRIDREHQRRSFLKFKVIRWWAQSFLIGVPKIVCGWRDDDGIVSRLESFKTLELPRLVRDKRDMWDPTVCLNFSHRLLSWIRSVVTEDDPTMAYLIEWKPPFREVTIQPMPKHSQYTFLPDWYTRDGD